MKHLSVLLFAAALCLSACGGTGGTVSGVSAAEASSAENIADVTGAGTPEDAADAAGEGASEEAADAAGASASEDAADAAGASASEDAADAAGASASEDAAGTAGASGAEDLTVTFHKQEGKHIVTAGSLTISVPTTFEGLEQEGAEFQGDDEIVRAGRSGSCRVKYRGAFNSIQLNVHNNTDYDMAVRDCTVSGIEIGSAEPDPLLTLYGIPMGASRQQIADVYGEPFSKTFDDENHMSNMVYQFGTDIYSKQIVMIIFRNSLAVSASYDDFEQVVN